MNTLSRTASTLALVAVATLGGGPSTAAVIDDYRDVRGEGRTGLDLHSVRLASTDHWVTVRTTHRDLRGGLRAPGGSIAVFLDVDRTRKGPEYAFVGGTSRGTDYALVEAEDWEVGDRVHEAELDMDVDYDRDSVRVRIARAALGDPQQLRIAVRSDGQRPDGTTDTDWLRTVEHLTPWVELPRQASRTSTAR